jgi:septation ring formation regulator EzrA
VSNQEDKGTIGELEAAAFEQLEEAVDGAVARLKELRTRLSETQDEGQEMKDLLRKFTEGEEEPARLFTKLRNLEAENQELLERLKRGREGVERLLARIRFLEEQG